MKNKYYTILGEIEDEKYRAEIYPHEHIILCSSGFFGGLLKNAHTESRAADIAKQALWKFCQPIVFVSIPFFKNWLLVEMQTCFGDVRLTKVTGLRDLGNSSSAHYEQLTTKESAAVTPLVFGFIARLRSDDTIS